MTIWQATDLLVADEPLHVGSADTVFISMDAGQAITAGAAALVTLPRRTSVNSLIVTTTVTTPNVVVKLTGFTVGTFYELAVTFTNAATEEWTRTLNLYCAS